MMPNSWCLFSNVLSCPVLLNHIWPFLYCWLSDMKHGRFLPPQSLAPFQSFLTVFWRSPTPSWGAGAIVLALLPLLFLLPLSACPAKLRLSHVSLPRLSSFQTTLQAHESQGPGSYCYWHFFVLPPNDAAQKDHENVGQA